MFLTKTKYRIQPCITVWKDKEGKVDKKAAFELVELRFVSFSMKDAKNCLRKLCNEKK